MNDYEFTWIDGNISAITKVVNDNFEQALAHGMNVLVALMKRFHQEAQTSESFADWANGKTLDTIFESEEKRLFYTTLWNKRRSKQLFASDLSTRLEKDGLMAVANDSTHVYPITFRRV